MFGISGGSFGGSGVKKYAVVADLPLTGVKPGTLAHVEENLQGDSALYLWSGTQQAGGWYKVATVNLAPNITTALPDSIALPTDGSSIGLTLAAEDPEGLPVSWSYQVASGDAEGVAVISQEGSTFTITADPAAIAAQAAGAFSLTFVASDGVSMSAATSAFKLAFSVGPADPMSATEVGSFPIPAGSDVIFAIRPVGDSHVAVIARNASSAGEFVCEIWDVSNPSAPVKSSDLPVPAGANYIPVDSAVSGDRLLVLSGAFLYVFDVSDPENPVYAGATQNLDGPRKVIGYTRDFAFVAGNDFPFYGVWTIDLETRQVASQTDLQSVQINSNQQPRMPRDYDGDVVLFTHLDTVGSTSQEVFSVFRVGADGSLTSLALDVGWANEANISFFDGRYAYGKAGGNANGVLGELQVWDLIDPTSPQLVFTEGQNRTGPYTTNFYESDGYLYALWPADGLHVYDVSDPTSVVHIGIQPEALSVTGIGTSAHTTIGGMIAVVQDDGTGTNVVKLLA
mgnify:CR=1 FL=1